MLFARFAVEQSHKETGDCFARAEMEAVAAPRSVNLMVLCKLRRESQPTFDFDAVHDLG